MELIVILGLLSAHKIKAPFPKQPIYRRVAIIFTFLEAVNYVPGAKDPRSEEKVRNYLAGVVDLRCAQRSKARR